MSAYCFGNDEKIEETKKQVLENPTKEEIEKLLALNSVDCLTQLEQIINILKRNLTHTLCPDRRHGSTKNRIIIKEQFEIIEEAIRDIKSEELRKTKEI